MSLENELTAWPLSGQTSIGDAMDVEDWLVHLGMLFRLRAVADPKWVWIAIESWPGDVMYLSPWIGRVVVVGVPFPQPGMLWGEWIESVKTIEGV